ncbi:MAG: host attachment family protein [Burkholderiaceae bacterium]|nr:host attachment family protein [Burkholderiaceae bacterium]MCD8516665.1 host attachment family protein [Burkholderiaceae bacterium]MCD8536316.1 host attachment family protein [Burkholderiaceae bacterium]MCD8564446.1 host attachment family protein [Burkholderiaceae bacterium]
MRIGPKTLLLIADGQSATFFRNTASGETISLEPVHSMGLFNEADRELSDDRPGHTQVGMTERRTAYEHRDKHKANETDFLKGVATISDTLMAKFDELVLVAEPQALGVLRQVMQQAVMAKVTTQIGKDYTKTAMPELEALLRAA